MKILHTVEYYSPISGGAQEVVKQISEHLVKKGHEVTVVTTKVSNRNFSELNGVKIIEFDISGNHTNGYHGDTLSYINYVLTSDFDVIMNYAAQQWTTDLLLPILDKIRSKKVFVPCGFSALRKYRYREYYASMKEWIQHYDVCIYLSNQYQDYLFAQKVGAKNSVVIPNGASASEFLNPIYGIKDKFEIPDTTKLILHVGSHTGLKGHKEAMSIYYKADILNPSVFLLIGNKFSILCALRCMITAFVYNQFWRLSSTNKRIIVAECSRTETIQSYFDADIFLFPSNIECSPIVLFEAMASGTPILTTDVGNSKEIVEMSHSGLILPTIKKRNGRSYANTKLSARLLSELMVDNRRLQLMGSSGRKVWLESFTWEKISDMYEEIYYTL